MLVEPLALQGMEVLTEHHVERNHYCLQTLLSRPTGVKTITVSLLQPRAKKPTYKSCFQGGSEQLEKKLSITFASCPFRLSLCAIWQMTSNLPMILEKTKQDFEKCSGEGNK